jgi:predicted acylesterase/phospholipase RssA
VITNILFAFCSARSHIAAMQQFNEKQVLVLQGGGALGAYQAGAYEALATAGLAPDWIAGISIGAINAALISGNLIRPAGLLAFARKPRALHFQ